MEHLDTAIVLIPLLAVMAPLAARAIGPRLRVPVVVFELALGFLVPLFFIYTGVTFDLASLLDDPRLLAMVPLALLVLLAVRGLPSALAAPQGSDRKTTAAVVLLGATGLPIIVAVTAIGVDEGLISSGLASVLVGPGMLSVLLFPLIGMALRGDRVPSTTVRVDDEV
ncbi:cation:proton antiporter domain-containing protein [Microbacterium aurum]